MDTTPNWTGGAADPLGSYGATTLDSLVAQAARRLEGSNTYVIWSKAELEGYAQLGYEQFCALTRALWDSRHLPARHEPVYTPDKFAREDAPASSRTWETFVPSQDRPTTRRTTARYAEDLVMVSDPAPFLGGGQEFARQAGQMGLITTAPDVLWAGVEAPNAEIVLPDDVLEVERVTYDGRRLQALTAQEANRIDCQWEQYSGYPSGFIVRQEGGRKILKLFRGPAEPADIRPYTQETGILRGGLDESDTTTTTVLAAQRITLTPFALQYTSGPFAGQAASLVSTFFPYPVSPLQLVTVPNRPTVVGWAGLTETAGYNYDGGPYGIARRISGTFCTGGPFGAPRRWNPGEKNTRIDYVRKAPRLTAGQQLHIQDWDARNVLWFVLSRAYSKDCPGQNLKAAEHYQQRWELGVSMVKARWGEVREGLAHVMGRGRTSDTRDTNPTAQLPWQYGRN